MKLSHEVIATLQNKLFQYEMQLTFRQEWLDPRLNFGRFGKVANFINLPPGLMFQSAAAANIIIVDYDIWMPDTFFQNELSAERHKIDTENSLIRVLPDGSVMYSTRLVRDLFHKGLTD